MSRTNSVMPAASAKRLSAAIPFSLPSRISCLPLVSVVDRPGIPLCIIPATAGGSKKRLLSSFGGPAIVRRVCVEPDACIERECVQQFFRWYRDGRSPHIRFPDSRRLVNHVAHAIGVV